MAVFLMDCIPEESLGIPVTDSLLVLGDGFGAFLALVRGTGAGDGTGRFSRLDLDKKPGMIMDASDIDSGEDVPSGGDRRATRTAIIPKTKPPYSLRLINCLGNNKKRHFKTIMYIIYS